MKARSAARGWVTRASKRLMEVCSLEEVDIVELNDAIDEFDKRLVGLDDAQTAVEIELPMERLDRDIDEAAEFRERARAPRLRAAKLVASQTQTGTSAREGARDDSSVASSGSGSTEAKLPKLELPSFGGEVTQWTSFWEQFQAVIHDSELPVVTKFTYLRSLLHGEAKATITGLSLTAAHYQTACRLLKERFGRPEQIVFSHIQELLNVTVPKNPDVSVLWNCYNDLQAHIRSLETLGITGEQYGVVLTPLILSRLSPALRMEWAREGQYHESDLNFLLDFLHGEVRRRERSQTFSSDCSGTSANILTERRGKVQATAAALYASAQDKSWSGCPLCGHDEHSLADCADILKMPTGERRNVLRSVGACSRCLSVRKITSIRLVMQGVSSLKVNIIACCVTPLHM